MKQDGRGGRQSYMTDMMAKRSPANQHEPPYLRCGMEHGYAARNIRTGVEKDHPNEKEFDCAVWLGDYVCAEPEKTISNLTGMYSTEY